MSKLKLLEMIFWNRRAINHLFTMISRGASWIYAFTETKRLRGLGHFKIIILGLLLSLCSCTVERGTVIEEHEGYNVLMIENCEYIEVKYGIGDSRVYSLTHKGNCKNHGK